MLNPKGLKKEFFSRGTGDSQNLRYETLATADYEPYFRCPANIFVVYTGMKYPSSSSKIESGILDKRCLH